MMENRIRVDRNTLTFQEGLNLRRARISSFQTLGLCHFSRHPKGPAGASQGSLMAASTCHPESTEPQTQVCQVRERPCDVEGWPPGFRDA